MGCCGSRLETLSKPNNITLPPAPILQPTTQRLKPASPLPAKPESPLPTKPASPLPTKPASPIPIKATSPIPIKPESPSPSNPVPSDSPAAIKAFTFQVIEGYNYLSSPRCPNSHPYQWCSDITFHYYELTGSWTIYCHGCTKTFSKPCWSCTDCGVNLCEQCGLQVELKKPSLKCTRDHELQWGVDTCAFYHSKGREFQFSCRKCKKKYSEPSWTCRECEFDVCIACGRNENMIPPKNLLVCNEKHPLTLYFKKSAKNVCERCNQEDNKKYYECKACKYVICYECGIRRGSLMIRHPGINCRDHHNSMCIINIEVNGENLNTCRVCNKSYHQYGFICNLCEDHYMYCIDCADLIGKHCENYLGSLNSELPVMEWKFNKSEHGFFNCKICNKPFTCHGFCNSTGDVTVCLHDIPKLDSSSFS